MRISLECLCRYENCSRFTGAQANDCRIAEGLESENVTDLTEIIKQLFTRIWKLNK